MWETSSTRAQVSTRTGQHRREKSVWQVCSEQHVASEDANEHFAWALRQLEPVCDRLTRYLSDEAFEVVLRIGVRCPDSIGGFSIDADKLRRLSVLAKRLDFSFMGEPAEESSAVRTEHVESSNGPQRVA
jgi:hypothetical protein